jgi:hypothetical protein
MGADNDRLFYQDNPPARFGSGSRGRFLRAGVDLRLRLQRRGAADLYRRRVSSVQLRNTRYSAHHGLHGEAPRPSGQRLPNGDGSGSGSAIQRRCEVSGLSSRSMWKGCLLPQEFAGLGAPPSRTERHCGTGSSALETPRDHDGGRNIMARFLFIIPLFLMASVASAQQQQQREHDACVRDVSRFCRAYMNDSDQVVLACLRQHRDRLGRACAKVLAEHGQ